MKQIIGSPGTVSGLLLRIGQFLFASASMSTVASAIGFSTYTSFCYLIASMGFQILWSFGLACLDIYALKRERNLQNPVLLSLFVVGDWVTAMLSLAAACSSAGVVALYARDMDLCKIHPDLPCTRFAEPTRKLVRVCELAREFDYHGYEISVLLAFITWLHVSI